MKRWWLAALSAVALTILVFGVRGALLARREVPVAGGGAGEPAGEERADAPPVRHRVRELPKPAFEPLVPETPLREFAAPGSLPLLRSWDARGVPTSLYFKDGSLTWTSPKISHAERRLSDGWILSWCELGEGGRRVVAAGRVAAAVKDPLGRIVLVRDRASNEALFVEDRNFETCAISDDGTSFVLQDRWGQVFVTHGDRPTEAMSSEYLAAQQISIVRFAFDQRGQVAAVTTDGRFVTFPGQFATSHGRFLNPAAPIASFEAWWFGVNLSHELIRFRLGPQEAPEVLGDGAAVSALAVSDDGRFLAAGTRYGAVRILDLKAEPPVVVGEARMAGVRDMVTALAFDRDSGMVAAGYDSREIRVWALRPDLVLPKEPSHSGELRPEARRAVDWGTQFPDIDDVDELAWVRSIETGRPIACIALSSWGVFGISSDGSRMAVPRRGRLGILSLKPSFRQVANFTLPQDWGTVGACATAGQGKWAIVKASGEDCLIYRLDRVGPEPWLPPARNPDAQYFYLNVFGQFQGTSDGRFLAVISDSRTVVVIRPEARCSVATFCTDRPVHAIALSPDGTRIAIALLDRVDVLRLRDGALQGRIETYPRSPFAVEWHPGGVRLAISLGRGGVLERDFEWDLTEHRFVQESGSLQVAWEGDHLIGCAGSMGEIYWSNGDRAAATFGPLPGQNPARVFPGGRWILTGDVTTRWKRQAADPVPRTSSLPEATGARIPRLPPGVLGELIAVGKCPPHEEIVGAFAWERRLPGDRGADRWVELLMNPDPEVGLTAASRLLDRGIEVEPLLHFMIESPHYKSRLDPLKSLLDRVEENAFRPSFAEKSRIRGVYALYRRATEDPSLRPLIDRIATDVPWARVRAAAVRAQRRLGPK